MIKKNVHNKIPLSLQKKRDRIEKYYESTMGGWMDDETTR